MQPLEYKPVEKWPWMLEFPQGRLAGHAPRYFKTLEAAKKAVASDLRSYEKTFQRLCAADSLDRIRDGLDRLGEMTEPGWFDCIIDPHTKTNYSIQIIGRS
jgi:hypothetical protein